MARLEKLMIGKSERPHPRACVCFVSPWFIHCRSDARPLHGDPNGSYQKEEDWHLDFPRASRCSAGQVTVRYRIHLASLELFCVRARTCHLYMVERNFVHSLTTDAYLCRRIIKVAHKIGSAFAGILVVLFTCVLLCGSVTLFSFT